MSTTVLPNLCFIGRAGAGKSSCFELLAEAYGYERLSFAGTLKVGCGTQTDRALLQTVGQGVRDLYEDFWVNLLVAEMQERSRHAQYGLTMPCERRFCVDDCRYPNELQRLKEEGFVTVRVVAPTTIRVDRLRRNGKLQDEAQLEHVSETALDDVSTDYRIINDGWPSDLLIDLEAILNKERS